MPKSSKHLDNDKKATKATGESKSGHLMDGIVGGLPKRVNPPIVDGIVRGIPRGVKGSALSSINASATREDKGSFGVGNYPEGKL